MLDRRFLAASLLLLAAVVAVYSNHFQNGFHFDDWHTITQNPAIRDLRNVPSFFTDGRTMSVLPANQAYRPVVTLSLAIDYWLGGGLQPMAFHASVFGFFLLLLGCTFFLYRQVLAATWGTAPIAKWTAFLATAWFALHPVSAETVNYVVQRADLYVALGLTMGLTIYVRFPGLRTWGLYLIPVVVAALCKPTALIFPPLLMVYLMVCEDMRATRALRHAVPSIGLTGLLAAMHKLMTPPAFSSATSPWLDYVLTQPYITLHYFGSWFLPLWLTADSDRQVFPSVWALEPVAGFVFVPGLCAAAVYCRGRAATRPIAFGLFWFLLTLLPVALMPLAEVQNDHRMFLPFVGLAISVTSALMLAGKRLAEPPSFRHAAVTATVIILCAFGVGTHLRNRVWLNEETLWRDVTEKSPRNGRGWMNYGLSQMAQGKNTEALSCFRKALEYTPNYSYLHINLGIVLGQMNDHVRAETHFQRALALAPADAQSHYYYGRYLSERGRYGEAVAHLKTAVSQNPLHEDARTLLARTEPAMPAPETAEGHLMSSLTAFQAGRYRDCIAAARRALMVRHDYAEAFNNIAAAHQALGEWDEAIIAAREAVRLRPDFQLARNNLAYAQQQKQLLLRNGSQRSRSSS